MLLAIPFTCLEVQTAACLLRDWGGEEGAARGLKFADKSSETHQDEDQIYYPPLMGGGKGLFS